MSGGARGSVAVGLATLVLLAACGAEPTTQFTPESARPGGPAFWKAPATAPPSSGAPTAPGGQADDGALRPFVRTDDAEAWIGQTIVLQKTYRRALLVGDGPALTSIDVPPPSVSGPPGAPVKVAVAGTFKTIAEALGEAKGGDLVAVRPGRYAGFTVGPDSSMKDGAYVVVKALGKPGEVIIDRAAASDPSWMVFVRAGHHVVIDGFAILGARDGKGPRAGIMLDGNFRSSSSLAHHVVVQNVWSDGHRKWGIHAVDSRTVLVQDSFFTRSFEEHGVYVSDGSDDWLLRRNVFFANNAGGLQINVDPLASFEEVMEHPKLSDHPRWENSRAWAEGLLRKGNQLFGEHAWPDGRGFNFLVEQNVMNENGKIGGAAINLASVSQSLFQNNLIYGNKAGGIAMWDNANPFDEKTVEAWPKTEAEARGVGIPLFGCRDNRVRNNTVIMDAKRAALQCRNGSTGCVLTGNLALNATGPGLEVFGNSVPGLDVQGNVMGRVDFTESTPALLSLAKTLPEGKNRTRVDARATLGELTAPSTVPWLRIDGAWPEPAPGRPDFHPRAGSSLATAGHAASQPPTDLEGKPRAGTAVVGALLPR